MALANSQAYSSRAARNGIMLDGIYLSMGRIPRFETQLGNFMSLKCVVVAVVVVVKCKRRGRCKEDE